MAVPESCTVNYNGTNILALDFDVDIQVKLVFLMLVRLEKKKVLEL